MRTHVDRRQFIASGVAYAAATATNISWAAEVTAGRALVDAHLHCFAGPGDARFPYHERAPYQPQEAATPQHLIKCMDEAGVPHAVVVHPEPYQDDHRYLEYCLGVAPGRLKGTLLLFADRAGSLEMMRDLAQRLDVVATRVHAYAPNRLPPFGRPELRNLWKQAGELGLAVQLHFEPRYAPGFEPLIKEFPDTRVIIDHLGRPFQATPEEYLVVVRWSRFENTIVKLSALPTTRDYPHRDIVPVVRQLTDAFGAERMIYGGGFSATATGASYRQAFETARSTIAHLSDAEQAQILGQNALRLFGFAKPTPQPN